MTTQNESANYDHQSFENYPTAPMFPAGWDLSEMQTETKEVEVEMKFSDETEAN